MSSGSYSDFSSHLNEDASCQARSLVMQNKREKEERKKEERKKEVSVSPAGCAAAARGPVAPSAAPLLQAAARALIYRKK